MKFNFNDNGLNQKLLSLSLSETFRKERIYPLINYLPLTTLIGLPPKELNRLGLIKKNHTFEGLTNLEKKKEILLRQCRNNGISLITILDKQYPFNLKNIYSPPLILFYQGELKQYHPQEGFYLAFIGSRRSDAYMNRFTQEVAYEFALRGGHVISGLAKGIDSFSHRGACLAQQPNTGVVANGLDIYYPANHKKLYQEILEKGGCLISEYPPNTKPLEYHFPQRNRIISALGEGIFVVQSPKRSGTRITVKYGLEDGKNIFTYSNFPSQSPPEKFIGNQELLKEGATPIKDLIDFFKKISHSPSFKKLKKIDLTLSPPSKGISETKDPSKNNLQKNLLALVKKKPLNINEMSKILKIKTEILSREILELMFRGKLRELPNKKYY